MARTQAADYDERKQAIVEAAAALFAARGFNGASVADIAQRGKISKSLVYHYYQSKEDILYDAMISHVRALEEAAREVMAMEAPPRASCANSPTASWRSMSAPPIGTRCSSTISTACRKRAAPRSSPCSAA
jgi:AcrR family transcriptional regulator